MSEVVNQVIEHISRFEQIWKLEKVESLFEITKRNSGEKISIRLYVSQSEVQA